MEEVRATREISQHESLKIIATYRPRGKFYHYDSETNLWIGIDNSDGNAWVEEFKAKSECLEWLG